VKLADSDSYYADRPVEHTAQGDIDAGIPLVQATWTDPGFKAAGARKRPSHPDSQHGTTLAFTGLAVVLHYTYQGWEYVLLKASPGQAASWRPDGRRNWKCLELPDLMFPTDRSWLVSTLWDDDWSCIGGPTALINGLVSEPVLRPRARRVTIDQDATPAEFRKR
jgi:hypothetical protein